MNTLMCNDCKLFNNELNYCAFSMYIGEMCPNFAPNWKDNMNIPKPNNKPAMPKTRQIKPSMNKIIITTMLELPEYCHDCPCHDSEWNKCKADSEGRDSIYRPFWCPLKKEKDRAYIYRGESSDDN